MKKDKLFSFPVRALTFCLISAVLICLGLMLGFAADDNFSAPDNGIPVVHLNIDESRGTIEDMLHADNHSLYCYGSVSIDVPDGFHYSDFPDVDCQSIDDLAMSIRGRSFRGGFALFI